MKTFDNVDPITMKFIGGKRSDLLLFGIQCHKEMLADSNYKCNDRVIHRPISGKVNADFGGSYIRKVMGPSYICTPENLFDYPWAPLVCQLMHLRSGQIRACYPRLDNKIYKKFLKSDFFPLNPYLNGDDPIVLDQLMDLANHLKKAGM